MYYRANGSSGTPGGVGGINMPGTRQHQQHPRINNVSVILGECWPYLHQPNIDPMLLKPTRRRTNSAKPSVVIDTHLG